MTLAWVELERGDVAACQAAFNLADAAISIGVVIMLARALLVRDNTARLTAAERKRLIQLLQKIY